MFPELIIIGFGPFKLLLSFSNLSIVLGKKASKIETTELANYSILLWERKLVVSYLTIGGDLNSSLFYLNKFDKSQKRKPTPLEIV